MAKHFLYVKVFLRGKGSRVTRAAAYRAGERIRDERTSEVYNYLSCSAVEPRDDQRTPGRLCLLQGPRKPRSRVPIGGRLLHFFRRKPADS
jgi:hypothetical protein